MLKGRLVGQSYPQNILLRHVCEYNSNQCETKTIVILWGQCVCQRVALMMGSHVVQKKVIFHSSGKKNLLEEEIQGYSWAWQGRAEAYLGMAWFPFGRSSIQAWPGLACLNHFSFQLPIQSIGCGPHSCQGFTIFIT